MTESNANTAFTAILCKLQENVAMYLAHLQLELALVSYFPEIGIILRLTE
jgi:hypothetical protein